MGLYKLCYNKEDLSDGVLEKTKKENIDYEKHFENWLENSPHVLFDDDNYSTVMWIGRQVTASFQEFIRYPDLIGIDSNGDLVIVELKKGKTPREVVAQIFEYAAWASKLKYEDLNALAIKYYENDEQFKTMELKDIFNSIFYPDNEEYVETKFNTKQRLFIVAEEISKSVKEVVKYLNQIGNIDINCIKYEVFKASNSEFYISTEIEESSNSFPVNSRLVLPSDERWNGEVPVKEVVKDAVYNITNKSKDKKFTPKEVISFILQKYPNFNISTARCQLIQDCVNHTSRKHYKSGQQDLYYLVGKGVYRLYDEKTDGKWNWEGKRIE